MADLAKCKYGPAKLDTEPECRAGVQRAPGSNPGAGCSP